jgi:hypothetical protein
MDAVHLCTLRSAYVRVNSFSFGIIETHQIQLMLQRIIC